MKYIIDHDLHIHSQLSSCSSDPEQTPERILEYAKNAGLKQICLTDHYWDENVEGASNWYKPQNFAHISKACPLPQDESCQFLFGCETDMDRFCKIGIPKERFDDFDFIIVPTTHLHMKGFTFLEEQNTVETKTKLYVERFEAFLNADLPFKKVGIAHLTCSLIMKEDSNYLKVLDGVTDNQFAQLFKRSAELGCGIELNMPLGTATSEYRDTMLRPYFIAKEQGCKFYLGSDAHHPSGLDGAINRFKEVVDALDLQESDKFHIDG